MHAKTKKRKEDCHAIRTESELVKHSRSTAAGHMTSRSSYQSKQRNESLTGGMNMKRSHLWLAMLITAAFATRIFAAGTPAGTTIRNWAVGNYKDANGNDMATVYSDTVSTVVAQAAGVDIDPNDAKDIQRNYQVDYAMTITNTGNGSDTFNITASTSSSGSSTFSDDIYYDANGNGVIDVGESIVSATSALSADAEYDIVVRVSVSGGDRGEVGTTIVTATSQFNGSVNDADTLTSTVIAAEMGGTLTVDNQTKAPGDVITYTLIFNNTAGTDTAFNTLITLPVPSHTQWEGNVTLNGTATGTGQGVDVDAGDLAPGAIDTITYQVRVLTSAGAGDVIDNTVNINYDDSQDNAYTQVDVSTAVATDRVTVSQNFGLVTSVADDSLEGDPGDYVIFRIKVKNTGNGDDDYDISEPGSGWDWDFFLDANNDGTPDGAEITNTGNISAGDSTWIIARVSIPAGTADGAEDQTVVTFQSTNDGPTSSTETLWTFVTAPFLTLSKVVSPTGNQPPGTVLTYTVTVTNTGSGQATVVIVTDDIPSNTTYVDGSLEIDGSGKSDNTGDDEASYGSGTATFNLGTMNSSASHTVSFQVRIN